MPTKRTYRRYRRRTRRYPVRRRTTYRRRAFIRTRAPEYKIKDISFDGLQVSVSSPHLLNAYQRGDDDYNRDGIKMVNKSVSIKGYCTNGSGDSIQCRIMLVYDRRPAPSFITDLLDTDSTFSQRNHDNLNRFVVLRDLRFTLSPEALQGDSRKISIYRRINLPTYFISAANNGDERDMQTGALWVITFASLGNAVSFICNCRTYALDV